VDCQASNDPRVGINDSQFEPELQIRVVCS